MTQSKILRSLSQSLGVNGPREILILVQISINVLHNYAYEPNLPVNYFAKPRLKEKVHVCIMHSVNIYISQIITQTFVRCCRIEIILSDNYSVNFILNRHLSQSPSILSLYSRKWFNKTFGNFWYCEQRKEVYFSL